MPVDFVIANKTKWVQLKLFARGKAIMKNATSSTGGSEGGL
jgi:hypothetical protein